MDDYSGMALLFEIFPQQLRSFFVYRFPLSTCQLSNDFHVHQFDGLLDCKKAYGHYPGTVNELPYHISHYKILGTYSFIFTILIQCKPLIENLETIFE